MPLPTPHLPKSENATLRARAEALHLHGLLTHWSEVATQPGLAPMLDWEEQQRARRSLERRLSAAHIGRFKPLCDFDWTWPKHCDRAAVDALITLDFLKEAANVVFVGPNGVGKSMFAQNIAHQAVIDGHTVLFTSAGQLLGDLCALDSDSILQRRLRHYARPQLLVIDEVGYLSYSNRHADMLFQLVSRRYQNKSTLITTNRAFGEWNEVFPNAACVVSLVDRLVHNAEIVAIEGESYRLKEARDRADARARKRRSAKSCAQCPTIFARSRSKSPSPGRPSRRSPFGRCSTSCARKSGSATAANCRICWPRSSDAPTSTTVTQVLGISTSNRPIVQRLNRRPQRPSCCSIKTAILPSRPARAHAVARSGGPGCPQGIAVGDAQRPGRLRARRHSHRRDGRQCDPPIASGLHA